MSMAAAKADMAFEGPSTSQQRSAVESEPRTDVDRTGVHRRTAAFVPPTHATLHTDSEPTSFTFVCLGVGGGPLENDCSCYLLKAGHRTWEEGYSVLEGGSWLGALTRVLEDVGPSSAFHDADFQFSSPALRAGELGANAQSFLISHAHLDHILGLVLSSASLPGKRNVYGLKGTLDNLLGVFNGKIWPKLASYEKDSQAMYKLTPLEPQTRAIVDKDFTVLPFALSHGLNPAVIPAPPTPTPAYASRLSLSSKRLSLPLNGYFAMPGASGHAAERAGMAGERPVFTSPFAPEASIAGQMTAMKLSGEKSPTTPPGPVSIPPEATSTSTSLPPNSLALRSSAANVQSAGSGSDRLRLSSARSRRPRTAQGSEKAAPAVLPPAHDELSSRSSSIAAGANATAHPSQLDIETSHPALDSTAFFITNNRTGKDVLFFGDVEPDSVSQSPRNGRIWAHAGERFAQGKLNSVFLECSFPAAHPTEFLYGHLSVRHVFEELRTLARSVVAERKRSFARRQPKAASSRMVPSFSSEGASRRILASQLPPIPALHTSERTIKDDELSGSLDGLHIVIIHVKTALYPSYATTPRLSNASTSSYATAENDETNAGSATVLAETTNISETSRNDPGPDVGVRQATASPDLARDRDGRAIDPRTMPQRILEELEEKDRDLGLGVRFVMAQQGMRIDC